VYTIGPERGPAVLDDELLSVTFDGRRVSSVTIYET